MFCQACIPQLKECPECRQQFHSGNLLPVPKYVTQKLDELTVRCPDCREVKKRGDLKAHLEGCAKCIMIICCVMYVRLCAWLWAKDQAG